MYPNDSEKLSHARRVLQTKARDHARTPVQWTSGPNAGFCDPAVTPWMRVNDDYKTVNAEAQRKPDPSNMSVLQFWKRGLAQRKEHANVFVYGDFELLDEHHPKVFAYRRVNRETGEAFVVVLNFSREDVEWEVPEEAKVKEWAAGNYTAGKPEKDVKGKIVLKPWEGLLGVARGVE